MLAKTNKSIGPIDVFTQFSGKLVMAEICKDNKVVLHFQDQRNGHKSGIIR